MPTTKDSLLTTPLKSQQLLEVKWGSGNEIFNLGDIWKKIAPKTLETREIRHEDDLVVLYKPSLEIVNDHMFRLTYQDHGVWLAGDAEGTESDGDLGVATYQLSDGKSKPKWVCSWTPLHGLVATESPRCTVIDSEKARLYRACFRSVRDAEFRNKIFDRDPCCAITGETDKRVLDAAHILQVRDKGQDSIVNGIVLRKDLHALFDAHVLRIDEDGRFEMKKPMLKSYVKYKDFFDHPRGISEGKVLTLLENIRARNSLIK